MGGKDERYPHPGKAEKSSLHVAEKNKTAAEKKALPKARLAENDNQVRGGKAEEKEKGGLFVFGSIKAFSFVYQSEEEVSANLSRKVKTRAAEQRKVSQMVRFFVQSDEGARDQQKTKSDKPNARLKTKTPWNRKPGSQTIKIKFKIKSVKNLWYHNLVGQKEIPMLGHRKGEKRFGFKST